MIIAHRGNHKKYPENTISAFESAIGAGADAIECDMRLTKDNVPVVAHYNKSRVGDRIIKISEHNWKEIKNLRKNSNADINNIDELFEFIKSSGADAFIEVKQNNPILARKIVEKIEQHNLWTKVHILGFVFFIKNSLALQAQYPKLRIVQLLMFPLLARVNIPQKSYGLAIGWLEIFLSRAVFKTVYPNWKLKRFNNFYKSRGFNIFAGVTNDYHNFEYFDKAGIRDFFTDNLPEAVAFAKNREKVTI